MRRREDERKSVPTGYGPGLPRVDNAPAPVGQPNGLVRYNCAQCARFVAVEDRVIRREFGVTVRVTSFYRGLRRTADTGPETRGLKIITQNHDNKIVEI